MRASILVMIVGMFLAVGTGGCGATTVDYNGSKVAYDKPKNTTSYDDVVTKLVVARDALDKRIDDTKSHLMQYSAVAVVLSSVEIGLSDDELRRHNNKLRVVERDYEKLEKAQSRYHESTNALIELLKSSKPTKLQRYYTKKLRDNYNMVMSLRQKWQDNVAVIYTTATNQCVHADCLSQMKFCSSNMQGRSVNLKSALMCYSDAFQVQQGASRVNPPAVFL